MDAPHFPHLRKPPNRWGLVLARDGASVLFIRSWVLSQRSLSMMIGKQLGTTTHSSSSFSSLTFLLESVRFQTKVPLYTGLLNSNLTLLRFHSLFCRDGIPSMFNVLAIEK